MKTYISFAKKLTKLLGKDQAVRITSEGYMPLSIEDIGPDGEGRRQIAMSHTAIQNGDLMRDPEIVFALHDWGEFLAAEPISFRNDFTGTMDEVYLYDDAGRRSHVYPTLKKDLKSFTSTWFRNLYHQGFCSSQARRERLS